MPKKVDKNQPEIVSALRRVGAYVLHTHEIKNAFDLLVIYKGKYFIAEIKNPEYKPKKRYAYTMLTEGELLCKRKIEYAGGEYHIWFTAEQALEDIGAI